MTTPDVLVEDVAGLVNLLGETINQIRRGALDANQNAGGIVAVSKPLPDPLCIIGFGRNHRRVQRSSANLHRPSRPKRASQYVQLAEVHNISTLQRTERGVDC